MKGYKGMTKDMTCRGMKFEISKTYHVNGNISICENGLHFCEKLLDVLYYYSNNNGNRFFEVEADGEIKTNGMKSVASSLTIIREINSIELDRVIYDHGYCNTYDRGDGTNYSYGNDIYSNIAGDGYGDGYGDGHGNGIGYGYGTGYGGGHGNGFGLCNSYGDGYGNGSGSGNSAEYGKNIIKYI